MKRDASRTTHGLMKYEDRVKLVSTWASNDANWIVERDEGLYKWQRIRFETIEKWKIGEEYKKELKELYESKVTVLVREGRARRPREPIMVSTI